MMVPINRPEEILVYRFFAEIAKLDSGDVRSGRPFDGVLKVARVAPGRIRSSTPMHEALEPTQDLGWLLTHEGYNVLSESA